MHSSILSLHMDIKSIKFCYIVEAWKCYFAFLAASIRDVKSQTVMTVLAAIFDLHPDFALIVIAL